MNSVPMMAFFPLKSDYSTLPHSSLKVLNEFCIRKSQIHIIQRSYQHRILCGVSLHDGPHSDQGAPLYFVSSAWFITCRATKLLDFFFLLCFGLLFETWSHDSQAGPDLSCLHLPSICKHWCMPTQVDFLKL